MYVDIWNCNKNISKCLTIVDIVIYYVKNLEYFVNNKRTNTVKYKKNFFIHFFLFFLNTLCSMFCISFIFY